MRERLLRALLLTYGCLLVDVLANLVSSDGLKEDIFFEILEPESLRYTFRLRPAHEFGSSFARAVLASACLSVLPNSSVGTF
uniref:Protease-associated domain-containing protein of 21 kDa n=1 Tax=Rhipicephalus appendiculatus TaxID=34631 RepID=A0A131YJW4_RHIAP